MVESFYETLGFELLETKQDDSDFRKEYELTDFNIKPTHFIKEDYQND